MSSKNGKPLKRDNCKWYDLCPMKGFFKKGKLESSYIEGYCFGNWQSCVRFQMEEKGIYHPDNMLPDGRMDPALR